MPAKETISSIAAFWQLLREVRKSLEVNITDDEGKYSQ